MDETRRARFMELAGVATVEAILERDRAIHGYKQRFVSKNLLAAYLAINSWLIIIRDYAGDLWYDVLLHLLHYGLIQTVADFNDSASQLIEGRAVEKDLVRAVVGAIRIDSAKAIVTGSFRPTTFSISLQICRYLKRMTLHGRDDVEKEAKRSFGQTQQSLGEPRFVGVATEVFVNKLRNIMAGAVDWQRLIHELNAMTSEDRTFTSGSSADAGGAFRSKVSKLAETNPSMFQPIMGSWLDTPSAQGQPEWISDADAETLGYPEFLLDRHKHVVRVSTAPKAMKGPRIIAMEPVNLQTAQKFAQQVLYRYFPSGMDLKDQAPNRELAQEGSRNGRYATLDLSAASDFVTKWLVCRIFPEEFVRAIWWMVPTHYQIGQGEPQLLYSFATMGNGLTFWVESMTFWAIATCAAGECVVYGDDIIVPTRYASRTIGLLELLGFRVNVEKSFYHGSFRESCGLEAVDGIPCHSTYFPRFPLYGEITPHTCTFTDFSWWDSRRDEWVDSTVKVVSLQQRLCSISTNAARFVGAVVRDAHPKMTVSRYGEVSPDLWGPETLSGPPRSAPMQCGSTGTSGATDGGIAVGKASSVLLPPEVLSRETWYAPHTEPLSEENDCSQLAEHLLYAEYLRHGPRSWRNGDPWLPYGATVDRRPEFMRVQRKVVWDLQTK